MNPKIAWAWILALALASAGAGAQSLSGPGRPALAVCEPHAGEGERGAADTPGEEDCGCDPSDHDNALPPAAAGKPWTVTLLAGDAGGPPFHLELAKAPPGLKLTPPPEAKTAPACGSRATLSWTPRASDLARSEVHIRVTGDSGGPSLLRLRVAVAGGNHPPEIDEISPTKLTEGQTLRLPITATDADGDAVTLALRNLPRGARFDATRGLLTWTPGYDQAGEYKNIIVKASDGKHSAERRFALTVGQSYMKPRLNLTGQILRVGEPFTLPLPGHMPGGLKQADGATVELHYYARWLPGSAEIDAKTGVFTWRPLSRNLGLMRVPVTLEAVITPADGGRPVTTSVTRELALNVLDADAPPPPAGSDPAPRTYSGGRGLAAAGSKIGPRLKTWIDQPVRHALDATDGQDHAQIWRVVDATNGKASIEADGATLLFTPAADYEGLASVTLQATSAGQPRQPVTLDVDVNVPPPQTNRPALKTHVDLPVSHALDALDSEGRVQFWRVAGATHGKARIEADGTTLLFTPQAGYAGDASVTVQAVGDRALEQPSQPITLNVNVSKARLLALRLAIPDESNPAPLRVGATVTLRASADFEDEENVPIEPGGGYLRMQAIDIAGMGYVGAQTGAADDENWEWKSWKRTGAKTLSVDSATAGVRFLAPGAALVSASRQDADGRVVRAMLALNGAMLTQRDSRRLLNTAPLVSPATLALPPGGSRQLQVIVSDRSSGYFLDAHAASQTMSEGVPARTEKIDDGPDGEIIEYQYEAIAPVTSGTRYFSGDERIATVSADGLVTAHAPGKTTISVVHLWSMADGYGGFWDGQAIGQQNIDLAVAVPQTLASPARPAVAVGKTQGAIVAAATGETVLIGPGALAQDSAVGIARIPLADLERATGMAAPAPGVLQALGAFRLDLGRRPSAVPLQLTIPAQDGIAIQPGEEVFFLRKGRVIVESGGQMRLLDSEDPSDMTQAMQRNTWWLVDNGTVGTDGLARAASAPYGSPGQQDNPMFHNGPSTLSFAGIDTSGQYVVMRRAPGVAGQPMRITIASGDWLNFGPLGITLGGGLKGISVESALLGALAAASSASLNAGSYHFGVAQFAPIKLPPQAPENATGKAPALDATRQLPYPVRPNGSLRAPALEKAPARRPSELPATQAGQVLGGQGLE
ncbi:MAG: Ig-like domain-containing protein [Desulfovibrionaceae bacterium]|nr:Ig-like domain-containing protein [Desulfovibrionaceae bacterium]